MHQVTNKETLDFAMLIYNMLNEDINFSSVTMTDRGRWAAQPRMSRKELCKVLLYDFLDHIPATRFGLYPRGGKSKPINNPKRCHVWVDPLTWTVVHSDQIRKSR
jgi:hypothetical protein